MEKQVSLAPIDLLVLLKLVALGGQTWYQTQLAETLGVSQSEVSKSLQRSKRAGLLNASGTKVMCNALLELIQYGIRYIYPQRPGALVRGIPTAHSADPLVKQFGDTEAYVWAYGKGITKGHSIIPFYPSIPFAAMQDEKLYELLALVDAVRVGKARERNIAVQELQRRILYAK